MAFSVDWLALREPADMAARDRDLLGQAATIAAGGLAVLDLGSGTGSTARAFDAAGAPDLKWRFVDNDPALLKVARESFSGSAQILGDLGDIDALPLDGVGLVTASALLDLMPHHWLSALAHRLRAAHIPFYAALNYDGNMLWMPNHPQDASITDAFNAHQRGDKGLGRALGSDSGVQAAAQFDALGFDVSLKNSPWRIGPGQAALHSALLDGIGAAAGEAGHRGVPEWTAARHAGVHHSLCEVGHTDLLAIPPEYGS